MKKLSYLIVLLLILGLALVGCVLFNPITPSLNLEKGTLSGDNGVCLDFTSCNPGDPVEGMDTLYIGLNVYTEFVQDVPGKDDGKPHKEAKIIVAGQNPRAYGSGSSPAQNGCLGSGNGIGIPRNSYPENDIYRFVFEFEPGLTVSSFSLNILDYGDHNLFLTDYHSVTLIAYDALGNELTRYELTYDSDIDIHPTESTEYDNLQITGDACKAINYGEANPGNYPGNYTFEVSYCGISKVVLELGEGPDPYFGIRNICFTPNPELEVPVDIKPTSCPNPLNTKSKGVTPVAILGTADFDVTEIDPSTITLAGVSPISLSWNLEDVATPFEPYTGKDNCDFHCNTLGPDGFLDLTLKFDTPGLLEAVRVINAMGIIENFEISEEDVIAFENGEEELVTTDGIPLEDGVCLTVTLNGTLYNGWSIVGEDVVRILQKGNNK